MNNNKTLTYFPNDRTWRGSKWYLIDYANPSCFGSKSTCEDMAIIVSPSHQCSSYCNRFLLFLLFSFLKSCCDCCYCTNNYDEEKMSYQTLQSWCCNTRLWSLCSQFSTFSKGKVLCFLQMLSFQNRFSIQGWSQKIILVRVVLLRLQEFS